MRPLFLSAASFDAHCKAQEANKFRYLATFFALQQNGAGVLQGSKALALAAAYARHDHELADFFLKHRDGFGVVEVLKALTILDAGRRGRVEKKRVLFFKNVSQTAGKKGKSRIG